MDKVAVIVSMACAIGIFWACVCRLQKTHRNVLPRVRYRYAIIGTGSLCAALFPFIPNWERSGVYGVALFFISVMVGFLLDRKDWAKGVPESATMPGELHEFKPNSTSTRQEY